MLLSCRTTSHWGPGSSPRPLGGTSSWTLPSGSGGREARICCCSFFVGEFLSASGAPVPSWSPGTAEGMALGQHEPPDWVWRRLTPVRPCWGLGGTMPGSHHFGSLFQMCLWPPPPLFGFGLLTANCITAGGLASHTVPKDKTNSTALISGGPVLGWLTSFHNNTLHFSFNFSWSVTKN